MKVGGEADVKEDVEMDAKGDIEIDIMFDLREMVRWTLYLF